MMTSNHPGSPPSEASPPARPRILLVDDNLANLIALEAALTGIDIEPVRATSGEEALRRVLAEDFALILLDVQMPGIDGFETARLIRERPASTATPIIFLSAVHHDSEQHARGYEHGAVDYLVKPLDPYILRSKVAVFHELWQARARIRIQEEQIRAQRDAELFDAMPQLGWIANADGWITYYNRSWYDYTGTTFAQMEGWGWQSVHDPDHLKSVLDAWSAAIAAREPFEMMFPLRRRDGVFRRFMTRATPILDTNGAVVRWIGINTDIDDQLRAEEALRRAAVVDRERLDRMFRELPAAICLLRGEQFTIEVANARVHELWAKGEAVVGLPLLEALPELRGQGFDELLRGVLRTGVAARVTEVRARIDRAHDCVLQDVYFDFVFTRLPATDGGSNAVFVHAYDVTDKVMARRALADAVRSRADLIAIVSHDLRNPLSTVMMAAKRLDLAAGDGELGQRTRKSTGVILRAVDAMTRLVSDLLDLSKLEAGQSLPIELESVDVVQLARQVVEAEEPLATAKKLTLHADLGPSATAMCDADRVQQVLNNLIGNAMKFTREGGTIRVATEKTDRELVISVSDTGIGIADEELPHIFSPYWQANGERKGGAGLGLSIAKAIVEAHGGRIWVKTAPDRGSTFYFTLASDDATTLAKGER